MKRLSVFCGVPTELLRFLEYYEIFDIEGDKLGTHTFSAIYSRIYQLIFRLMLIEIFLQSVTQI
jgi:hypothetical protein